jgi:short subunit dehydrogenase-like uncharacterized protein
MDSDPDMKAVLNSPFPLGGGPTNAAHLAANDKPLKSAKQEPELCNLYVGPGAMSVINEPVVRASAGALGYARDGDFSFYEVGVAGTAKERAERMAQPPPPPDKRREMMKSGRLPKPGEGPPPDKRAESWFQYLLHAESSEQSADGKAKEEVWISVTGGEAGYEDTAMMCCCSALILAFQRDALPRNGKFGGGVLTPAVAFGSTLIERLNDAGMRFREIPSPNLPGNVTLIRGKL